MSLTRPIFVKMKIIKYLQLVALSLFKAKKNCLKLNYRFENDPFAFNFFLYFFSISIWYTNREERKKIVIKLIAGWGLTYAISIRMQWICETAKPIINDFKIFKILPESFELLRMIRIIWIHRKSGLYSMEKQQKAF